MVHKDEQVLPPEEAAQYRAEHPEAAKAEPSTDASLKLKPYGQVIEDKANAKAAEQVRNPNPTGQPSVSNVEGNIPEGGATPKAEEKPKMTYGHILADQWMQKNVMPSMDSLKAPKELNQGAPDQGAVENGMTAPAGLNQGAPDQGAVENGMTAPAGLNQGAKAPAGLKPIVQPETTAPAGPAQAPLDHKATLQKYDSQIQAALNAGTPEGHQKALLLQEAKQNYLKSTPWGSATNHPGILGKLGHAAEMIASRAPGLAPIMATIPGSEGYRAGEQRATQAAIPQAEQAVTAREAEENKADKTATGSEWKLNANVIGPNGRAVLENAKTGETKEAPEGYTAYDKPVHLGDQAAYMDQWYKDHQDAPKSAANDDKAIEAYSNAKQATAQENKAKGQTRYYNTPEGRRAYTYAEAKAAGLNPVEEGSQVASAQVEKDRKAEDTYEGLKSQLGQYQKNIAKSANSLLPSDIDSMASVIESVESPDYVSKIVSGAVDDFYGKPVTGYNEKVMKGALTKKAYDDMSPAARQLVADYFTTLLAHFGNVKATLGQVPRNEKLITTEMNMIPKPYLNAAEAGPAFSNYMAQVERNNAHNVRFGTQKTETNAPVEKNQRFQMTDEEKNMTGSITMPDGSHPAYVHKDPSGRVLVFSGKAGDPWVDPATGKAVK
jgi:hypothetical protein